MTLENLTDDELKAELERRQKKQAETEKPKLITENVNLSDLVATCQEYIECLSRDDYCDRDDFKHYIYEEVMKALYGQGVFDWINKHL